MGRVALDARRRIVPLEDFDAARWEDVEDVVSGIGLLVADGRPVSGLGPERASPGFDIARHPRSLVGVDRRGHLWLVAVDGRRPGHSLGMTFRELQGLAALLGLTDALNLDGGGSTTLVALGRILNCPSDAAGPRAVSDAIVVLPAR
ncbi:MAG: phosphodiester glycosidase family protein [Acidobacteria bacterium]|nr:phosphodiester glycosidase family protein [Acidobacteriota bacterium]